jgi:hypothetical protein
MAVSDSPTAGWSLDRLRAASDPMLKAGATPGYVGQLIERGKGDAARAAHIDSLGRGSRATGDHQPNAGSEMLEEATKHIGDSRDQAFRGQLNAIESATPKTIDANVNWRGRGDD